jgi:hypothetical protein
VHSSPQRLRAVALAGLLAVSLAACGSTVQQTGQAQLPGGGGLGGLPSQGTSSLSAGEVPGAVGVTGPAGTTSTSTGGSAPGAGSTVPGAPATGTGGAAASAPAGAAVTKPITVGFVTVDYAKAASALGAPSSGDRSFDQDFKDSVAAFKAAGGLGGRPIKPLYYVVDGTSANYETEFESACAYFTQDNKVDMVATFGMVAPPFSQCLAKKGVPEYNGMGWTLPRAVLDKTPGFFGPVGLTHEQTAATTVDVALRQGWIKKGDKVGIVVDGCPEHEAAAKQIVQPRLSRAGINYVTVVPYGCPKGFGSAADISSGTQSAVLKFRSAGVTTVMYVTYVENVVHLAFVQHADSQAYVPQYLLNTDTLLQADLGFMPERQRVGMHGIGWQPVTDLFVKPASPSPARTACLNLLDKAKVPPPRNANEQFALFTVCDLMRLMDAQLRLTNGSARISDLAATRSALRNSFTSAVGWGPVDLTDGQGPEFVAPFSYRRDCKCVKFDGKPVPLGRV